MVGLGSFPLPEDFAKDRAMTRRCADAVANQLDKPFLRFHIGSHPSKLLPSTWRTG